MDYNKDLGRSVIFETIKAVCFPRTLPGMTRGDIK